MVSITQQILKPTRARGLDTSGNNNHAQIYSGRALEFDGVTDSLTVPDNVLNGKDWRTGTVATWVYLESTPNTSDRILSHYTDDNTRFYFAFTNTGKLRHQLGDEDGFTDGDTVLNLKTWYRVVFAWNVDGTANIYINGVLDKADTGIEVNTLNTVGTNPLSIGTHNTTTYLFDGKMSDFQMWNSVWTADDVTYDYLNPEQLALNRGGTSLTNSNLKLWYPMNDGHRGNQSYVLDASNTGLGDELLTNGDFSDNSVTTTSGGSTLAGWSNGDTHDSNHYFEIVNGQCRLYTADSTATTINQVILTSGVVYKYSFTVNTSADGMIKIMHGSNTIKQTSAGETGTFTGYFTAAHATFKIVRADGAGANDITFDNVSIKTVNAKNNATTAFYGDEMVANGDCEVTDPTTITISGVAMSAISPTTIDDSTTQANGGSKSIKALAAGSTAWPGVKWVGGDEMSLIVGRTYYMECYVYMPSGGDIDRVQLKYRTNDGTSIQIDAADDDDFDTWTKLSGTFLIPDDITDIQIIGYEAGSTDDIPNTEFFYFDDISLKEVGIATGWTDADQQLDIPQTALQSYNQLACNFEATPSSHPIGTASYSPNFGTDSFVVSFSMFPNVAEDARFMYQKESGSAGRFVFYYEDTKELEIYIDSDAAVGYSDITGTILEPGQWHHIIAIFNRSADTITAYVNGEAQSQSVDISSITGTMNGGGVFYPYSFDNTNDFQGCLTEIAYWKNTTFSDSDAEELYNSGLILDATKHSKSSTLINYWRNNGLADWEDLVGSTNLTSNNMTETMLITAGVDSSRDSQGFLMNRQRTTNSLNLDGDFLKNDIADSGAYASVGDQASLDFGTDDFSVAFWFKFNRDDEKISFVGKQDTSSGWYIYYDSDANKINFYHRKDSKYTYGSTNPSVDTWYHCCFTRDGAAGKIYLNGSDDTGSTQDISASVDSSGDLFEIGRRNLGSTDDRYSDAQIDDLLIYSDKLEAPEVTRIYNAGKRSHR